MLHMMACSGESNLFGLELKIFVMEESASIADPSTTSSTVTPIMFLSALLHATLTTTDPPILGNVLDYHNVWRVVMQCTCGLRE